MATWNEQWTEAVIKHASSLILGKVVAYNENGLTIQNLKHICGNAVSETVLINKFSLLECSSYSYPDTELRINIKRDTGYFFISANEDGTYSIATPTTGWDRLRDGKVEATYRISFHQALVPVDVYEKTMTAIFNHYHGNSYDADYMKSIIGKYLLLPPAQVDRGELETFFMQHVALESIYHLRFPVDDTRLLPFILDEYNFHNAISGARAAVVGNTLLMKQTLIDVIAERKRSGFLKIMCIWTLAEFHPMEKEFRLRLLQLEQEASTQPNDFGCNIMDPRIGTYIPTVKQALKKLNGQLKNRKEDE
jgi:hypothetical protein